MKKSIICFLIILSCFFCFVPSVTMVASAQAPTFKISAKSALLIEYGSGNVILISVHANAAGNGQKWMTAKGWSAFTTRGNTKSDKLAEFLYDAATVNFPDRKIRTDKSDGDRDWETNFYICLHSKCPAVLTENFFYDNTDDVQYILSDEGREAVIKTHIDGITNYIKDTF